MLALFTWTAIETLWLSPCPWYLSCLSLPLPKYASIPCRIIVLDSAAHYVLSYLHWIIKPMIHFFFFNSSSSIFFFLNHPLQSKLKRVDRSLPKSKPQLYSCISVHASHVPFSLSHFHQYFVISFILFFFSWSQDYTLVPDSNSNETLFIRCFYFHQAGLTILCVCYRLFCTFPQSRIVNSWKIGSI